MPVPPWSRWSLTRKLPLLTAAIVVLVAATSLTVSYRALVASRADAMQERLRDVARNLATNSEQTNRQRAALLHGIAADSALRAALTRGATITDTTHAALRALRRVFAPTDSATLVELWTATGRRIARLGDQIPDDALSARPPELRARVEAPAADPPLALFRTDSVRYGSLYAANGRVVYWVLVPVFEAGHPLGIIAQQRRINNVPGTVRTVRALIGAEVSVYVRNIFDSFHSTIVGEPAAPPTRRDTAPDGFRALRGRTKLIGAEARLPGTPWLVTLELPSDDILVEPRRTIRRLALISALATLAGVVAAWLLSRRITRPIVELSTAASAIAEGDYQRRVSGGSERGDEVARLAASFNRMTSQVESAQQALAAQVDEARRASEALAHASAEAERARQAAEDANQAKSDFLAVMSHELRTPLNAIGGYAEILELGIYGEVTEKQREALRRIARSQHALLSLINDVLNFAKLEAGEVSYAIGDVSLDDALVSLESLVAPQLDDRRQRYRTHCEPGIVVRADPDKLQQILVNLLSNAIKFTAPEGEITVTCERRDGQGLVRVRDTGIGIAPERVESIFDPFIQVGRALHKPYEGVGLGLSISRDLAAGMGGALSVESTPGVGSTFTLALPLVGRSDGLTVGSR